MTVKEIKKKMAGWEDTAVHYFRMDNDSTQSVQQTNLSSASGSVDVIFYNFIKDFTKENLFVYKEKLRRNLVLGIYAIEILLEDLACYDKNIANKIKTQPGTVLPLVKISIPNIL